MRRFFKKIVITLLLLLFAGLLLFAHDDYDTMENWEWIYGEEYGQTFVEALFNTSGEDGWEDWGEDSDWSDWGEDDSEEEDWSDWGEDGSEEEDWSDWGEDTEEDWSDWGEDTEEDWSDWGDDGAEGDWQYWDPDAADEEGWTYWNSDEEDTDWSDWGDDGDEAWSDWDDGAAATPAPEDEGYDPENPPEALTGGDDIPEETEEEDIRTRNIRMLARLIFGEARGVDSRVEQAAVAWCALNRMDAEGYAPEELAKVVNSSHFGGYSKTDPVYPHHWETAESVYDSWLEERETGRLSDIRVLPKEYLYYWGTRTHNWFVTDKSYIGSKRKAWSFSGRDPYAAARRYHLKNYEPTEEEIEMMAQVLHHKARGVESEMERAAVVWCILNRVESPLYEDTVKDVLEHENQFSAYDPELEVRSTIRYLVMDVVERWQKEMRGRENAGRVLPKEYLYFYGDGEHNYFMPRPNSLDEWDWSLDNPYDD